MVFLGRQHPHLTQPRRKVSGRWQGVKAFALTPRQYHVIRTNTAGAERGGSRDVDSRRFASHDRLLGSIETTS